MVVLKAAASGHILTDTSDADYLTDIAGSDEPIGGADDNRAIASSPSRASSGPVATRTMASRRSTARPNSHQPQPLLR